MRKIIVDDKLYLWQYGKSSVVIIDQNKKKHIIQPHNIKKTNPDIFERGQYKKTSDGAITPKNISDYIKEHNL